MTVIQAEACIGCGARALQHPMVAVSFEEATDRFRAFPVCKACWTSPSHRAFPIKGHFFPRAQEQLAVARAGSSEIGG